MNNYKDEFRRILTEMVLEVENQLMVEASPFECLRSSPGGDATRNEPSNLEPKHGPLSVRNARTIDEKDAANLSFYYTGISMMAVALMRKLGE